MSARQPSHDDGRRASILKLIGAATIVMLIGWFILANTASVAVSLWWAEINIPLWIVVVAAFLAGWGFGILVRLWRVKRPRVTTE